MLLEYILHHLSTCRKDSEPVSMYCPEHGAIPSHPEKTTPQTHQQGGLHDLPLETEACFSQEQFSHSLGGFLDIAPQSPLTATKLHQMKLLTGEMSG